MNTLLLSLIVGLVAGAVDIAPMIIQKLAKHSIVAAFLFFFFISVIIFHSDIPYIPWWLQGGLISIAMMSPILIHVAATDKKPVPIITINTLVLGTIIGVLKHFLV